MQKQLPTGTVTFLFTDIEGSTPLWEQMPREMQKAVALHHEILREAIEMQGGYVFQILGDAFQASFWNAQDTLQAAIAAQRLLMSAPWEETGPLKVRMGLHTGTADLEQREGPWQGEYAVSHTLNRTARVMSAGHGGQILISQESAQLLMSEELPEEVALCDMGQHRLKGLQRLEHIYQVIAPGLPENFPPLSTSLERPNNLPAEVSRFIGRKKETREVIDLVNQYRLVTLSGSGGTGKTRLSLEVAGELLENFDHGIWFLELASISDPTWLNQSIANVFHLRQEGEQPIEEIVSKYLRSKHLLLIIDNCEHMIAACANWVVWMLRTAPGLRVLTSSREPLGVAGEAVYRVPSLSLPQTVELEDMHQSDAVQLFLERAYAVNANFRLTEGNALALMQICTRLDGIALALELAASRVRAMSMEQIAVRLDDRFRLLTGGSRTALPRQQTLRATIDWSYNLLSSHERSLFQRLAVFVGGWTLDAVELVCVDPPDISEPVIDSYQALDLLTSLVDKSLVLIEFSEDGETKNIETHSNEQRYRMLETIRQYASEILLGTAEVENLRNRHLNYFTDWAEQAHHGLRGREQKRWMQAFRQEVDNVRTALEWSLNKNSVFGLRLARASATYFEFNSHQEEGEYWLLQFLNDPDKSYPLPLYAESLAYLAYCYGLKDIHLCKHYLERSIAAVAGRTELPALAAIGKGWISMAENDSPGVTFWLAEAERLGREQQDWYSIYLAKNFMGRYANMVGDQESSWQYWTEMSEVARLSGNPRMIGWASLHVSIIFIDRGELTKARKLTDEALDMLHALGESSLQFSAPGFVAQLQGDTAAAGAVYEEVLLSARDWDDREGQTVGLCQLAYLAFLQSQDQQALDLLQEASQIVEQEVKSEDVKRKCLLFLAICSAEILAWLRDSQAAHDWLEKIRDYRLEPYDQADVNKTKGLLALQKGTGGEAATLFFKSLAFFASAQNIPSQVEVLECCADLISRKDSSLAVRILAVVNAFRERIGMPRYPRFKRYYEDLLKQLQNHLGDPVFYEVYATGLGLPLEHIIDETLKYLEIK